jgi:hypothetical protein
VAPVAPPGKYDCKISLTSIVIFIRFLYSLVKQY